MRTHRISLLLFASAFMADLASAQIVDQQQPSVSGPFGYSEYWIGQSFTPTASTVAGAGFYLLGYNGNVQTVGTLEVQLWSGRPDLLGSSMLAQGLTGFSVTGDNAGGSWFDVFWSPVGVLAGNTYFLTLQTSDRNQKVVAAWDSRFDPYNGGNIMHSNGSYSVTAPWFESTDYDMSFREFSSGPVSLVPEPTSAVLWSVGMLGIFAIYRRRRAK